jgi:hypothetical protein
VPGGLKWPLLSPNSIDVTFYITKNKLQKTNCKSELAGDKPQAGFGPDAAIASKLAPTERRQLKSARNPTTEIVHGPCFPSQLAVGRARQ